MKFLAHTSLFAVWFVLSQSALSAECDQATPCMFVLGNSITWHKPAPHLDWDGDWGMAASRSDLDFVSRLKGLLEGGPAAKRWNVHRVNGVDLERRPRDYLFKDEYVRSARNSRLLIVELGDNVAKERSAISEFSVRYAAMLLELRPKNGGLLCVSTWWTNSEKDHAIRAACEGAGGRFVDISGVGRSIEGAATSERAFSNAGVGAHPGDRGMKAIAESIYSSIPRSLREVP